MNSFVGAMSAGPTRTVNEKGAVAFSSTGRNVLDFFFQAVRKMPEHSAQQLLEAAWNEDPLLTLKAIFQLRDVRGKGKGERELFRVCLRWLVSKDPATLIHNLKWIPHFGRWDDLYALWDACIIKVPASNEVLTPQGSDVWIAVLALIREQIVTDWTSKQPSLLAKWLPREKCTKWPKQMQRTIMRTVSKAVSSVEKDGKKLKGAQKYRFILTTLHAKLSLPEVLLASKRSSEIAFNNVPGQAMRRYGKTCHDKCGCIGDTKCKQCKAFIRHEHDRFSAFLQDLVKPKSNEESPVAKVNARTLAPHEVVLQYMRAGATEDPMLEAMWRGINERITCDLSEYFPLVDVSSSMSGIPMQVAVALGLLISRHGKGPFSNAMLTFHEMPQFIKLNTPIDGPLLNAVQEVLKMPWGGSTQIHRAFTQILHQARTHNLKQEDLPKYFIILSDMQFDAADRSWRSNIEVARADFAAAGYVLPRLILWNLRSTKSFPTSEAVHDNATMMSGFSPDMLDCLLEGGEFNPASAMLNTLNNERYSCLELAVKN